MSEQQSSGNIHPSTRSLYREAADAKAMYDDAEVKHLRVLLRRLRFLESQLMLDRPTIGREFVVRERDSLIFTLTEVDYLEIHPLNESEQH